MTVSLLMLSLLPWLGTSAPAPRFVPVTVKNRLFNAELALTEEQHARGLMYRRAIADNYAMLFVFAGDDDRSFWMKNTLIPLDIIFIDSARCVINVAADVPPCAGDPCPTYSSEAPARYVLELRGGLAQEIGLRPGDRLDFVLPGR